MEPNAWALLFKKCAQRPWHTTQFAAGQNEFCIEECRAPDRPQSQAEIPNRTCGICLFYGNMTFVLTRIVQVERHQIYARFAQMVQDLCVERPSNVLDAMIEWFERGDSLSWSGVTHLRRPVCVQSIELLLPGHRLLEKEHNVRELPGSLGASTSPQVGCFLHNGTNNDRM